MHKILAFLLAFALLAIPLSAKLPNHPESIRPLTSEGRGMCTTWSANKLKGLWVTAGHCVAGTFEDLDTGESFAITWPLEIAGKTAEIAQLSKFGDGWDLALLKVDVHEPGLKLGDYPKIGDEVTVYGFPGGRMTPIAAWLRVSNPFHMWDKSIGMPWRANMIFDGNLFPGHSGSPILDKKGRVVSVAQGAFGDRYRGLALGVPHSVLKDFLVDAIEQ